MSTLAKRLLTFFIGIPAIIALIVFLPFKNYLAANIVTIIACGLGAVELSVMLRKRQFYITKTEAFILGALVPAALTLTVCFNIADWIILVMLMLAAGWVLLSRIFSKPENFEKIITFIAAGFILMIYPGFFMYWVIKIINWGNAGVILLFLAITFGYDSMAWLCGSLFGNNNREIIPASPNKSIAGFAGGIAGSIIIAIGGILIFPGIFGTAIISALLLGLFTGIAAALGDLAESAIKRSCDTKDSGKLMFGRGGVLDSIDSVAVAAPVFYLLYFIFFASV